MPAAVSCSIPSADSKVRRMSYLARALALTVVVACHAPTRGGGNAATEDFDAMWRFVAERYPFLGDKATDWDKVGARYRPRAAAAQTDRELMGVLEGALGELYDPHNLLNASNSDSWRPVPHDIYVEQRGSSVVVTGVREGSAADRAGVRVGQQVIAIDGVAITAAATTRLPSALTRDDPAARQWALLSAVAGRHGHERRLQVLERGAARELVMSVPETYGGDAAAVSHTRLDGGVGYLRIGTFAGDAVTGQVDQALDAVRDAPALVIDVRDNAGGDDDIARAIMGRFVGERRQHAWRAKREGTGLGKRWPEYVEPRGPWTYDRPVVVLIDRFSANAAEGFAMGMQGMGRARLVGTRMAGLGAAIDQITLPRSELGVQISSGPVFHVDGRACASIAPDVEVDVVARAGAGDAILGAGQAEALRLLAVASRAEPEPLP